MYLFLRVHGNLHFPLRWCFTDIRQSDIDGLTLTVF